MITFGEVKPYKEDGKTGIYIRGHADYAKDDDIVCAAVSAIGQTAAQAVEVYGKNVEIRHCSKGHIMFVCDANPEAELIIKTALLGLNSIKEQYPQCFTAKDEHTQNVMTRKEFELKGV